ncbi:MAG: HlyD family secretion protein, partial [Beijerinckiaceae bacterium]
IRKRVRPDNLKNQVRAGGQTFARKLYLYSVIAVLCSLVWTFTGHWFFLDAEGIVTKERTVIAPDYSARVVAIHVRPGDRVEPGQHVATLSSREIIDSLSDLVTRRGTVASREAQVVGRIETIRKLLPSAMERRRRALETQKQLAGLSARGLTTGPRIQDAQRELYESEREESSLSTELGALLTELKNLNGTLSELDQVIRQAQANYNEGKVVAQIAGTIGARVPHLGQIVKSGEPLVDIYRGDMFVLAYMPTGRLYSISRSDSVRVSDGQQSFPGRVERIEGVTDALPPEFQVTFRSQDRQQIFRIAFDQAPPFAIQAKVRLSGNWSPQGVMRRVGSAVMGVGEAITGWTRSPKDGDGRSAGAAQGAQPPSPRG